MDTKRPKNIDEYIAGFPPATRDRLQELLFLIADLIPDATEAIKYGMPCLMVEGKNFLYFAGYAKHIGLYSVPVHDEDFKSDVKGYKLGEGSIQLPLNKPMDSKLVIRLIERKIENSKTKL